MTFAIDLDAQSVDCHNVLTVTGTVINGSGKHIPGVLLQLKSPQTDRTEEFTSDSLGQFTLSAKIAPQYSIVASKVGYLNAAQTIHKPDGCVAQVNVVLTSRDSGHSVSTLTDDMNFADKPSFTIAGVTDWTAIGGHGSDSTLRTSESLVKSTVEMNSDSKTSQRVELPASTHTNSDDEKQLHVALDRAPESYSANRHLGEYYLRTGNYSHAIPFLQKALDIGPSDDDGVYELAVAYANGQGAMEASKNIHTLLSIARTAKMCRLAALEDEKAGNSLRAVKEFQEAAALSPSESSYFEWGSDLLLHRAVWQALDVFQSGAKLDPSSLRLQTAIAITLFSGARYNEAATQLCKIADANATNPRPYILMGEIQSAAPYPLDCIEPRLAKFAVSHPFEGEVNYLYGLAIVKRAMMLNHKNDLNAAQKLFEQAIEDDPKNAGAYLQLGILSAEAEDYKKAIVYYNNAINAEPELPEAYYRLGIAYQRLSELDKAKVAFSQHDQLQKQQQDATEKERLEIKQFLFRANQ